MAATKLLIKLLPDTKTILDDVHDQVGGKQLPHTAVMSQPCLYQERWLATNVK